MGQVVRLPQSDGTWRDYAVEGQFRYPPSAQPATSRVAFAAVPVAADPRADVTPMDPAAVDWDTTLAFRRHIWSYGLGVADAMDTAQRGMGLDWETCKRLIAMSGAEARSSGGRLVCGAQTDHLPPGSARSLQEVVAAYETQCAYVEAHGAQVALMASRELARLAQGPDDYFKVYDEVISGLSQPTIIHWLGEVFDPALRGYFGFTDPDRAMDVLLEIVRQQRARVDGIKLSLLDQRREVELRRRLPAGVRVYTGDDFDYPTTIAGDGAHHSDALLGAFSLIAPAAAAALTALDAGDLEGFQHILAPTVPLSRHVFKAPTYYYKVGVVFAAYLNGHQSHFRMVGGLESARSAVHLAELFVLADQAGLLRDADLAAHRLRLVLEVAGLAN